LQEIVSYNDAAILAELIYNIYYYSSGNRSIQLRKRSVIPRQFVV